MKRCETTANPSRGIAVGMLLFLAACAHHAAAPDACALAERPVGEPGKRTLALVAGVGNYDAPAIPDLAGPLNDAADVRSLLVGPMGVPEQNVCLLRDPTAHAFERAWKRRILRNLAKGDQVVVYFAGHGSQVADANREEADVHDESWVFRDSRARGHELVDDELNALWADAVDAGAFVSVLVDACHSGTSARGGETSREIPPIDGTWHVEAPPPRSLENFVTLAAAVDGDRALERGGHGYFTRALVESLGDGGTWAQVAERIRERVRELSGEEQETYAEGALEQPALGPVDPSRRRGWVVTRVDAHEVHLAGVPAPGMAVGAEVRIRRAEGEPLTGVVDTYGGFDAIAALDCPGCAPGDAVEIATPARDAPVLRVSLGSGFEDAPDVARTLGYAAGGLDGAVVLREGGCVGFCLEKVGAEVVLRGPEGRVRNRMAIDARLLDHAREVLGRHARQQAILMFARSGERYGEALQVWTERVGADGEGACGGWTRGCPNALQVIPRCAAWTIAVRNTLETPYLVGGAALWSNGAITGLPLAPVGQDVRDFRTALVDPSVALEAGPPLDPEVLQHIVVVGSTSTVFDWSDLTTPASATRGADAWTATVVDVRVSANPAWDAPPTCAETSWTPSGTVDLTPYRSGTGGALDRLLDALASAPNTDAAFQRAGLPPSALAACDSPPREGDRVGDTILLDPARGLGWRDGTFVKVEGGECRRHPMLSDAADSDWYLTPCTGTCR